MLQPIQRGKHGVSCLQSLAGCTVTTSHLTRWYLNFKYLSWQDRPNIFFDVTRVCGPSEHIATYMTGNGAKSENKKYSNYLIYGALRRRAKTEHLYAVSSTNFGVKFISQSQVHSNLAIPKKLIHDATIQITLPCQTLPSSEIDLHRNLIKFTSMT